ncbi:hypothetical protein QFZ32_006267 [Streptomyces canus]|uniref:Uncharacterized protein n=1 Tax=Streptomyces canus TaxID=58343 RepID=A0AAW8FL10_9ACTN|nr:hypothetical protein [Streptomyces canus]MDQ1070827.1 hypothetical protein [Streptomyces canus]
MTRSTSGSAISARASSYAFSAPHTAVAARADAQVVPATAVT